MWTMSALGRGEQAILSLYKLLFQLSHVFLSACMQIQADDKALHMYMHMYVCMQ